MHDAASGVLPAVPLVGVVDSGAERVDGPVVRGHGQEAASVGAVLDGIQRARANLGGPGKFCINISKIRFSFPL